MRRSDAEKVAAREAGERVTHSRLTELEALLVRALYQAACNWTTEAPDECVGYLKEEGTLDDEEAAILEQLLTEEEADRRA